MTDHWTKLEQKYDAMFIKGDNGSGIELYGFPGWVSMLTLLLEKLEKLGGVRINLIKEKWGCLRIQCHTVQGDKAHVLIDYVEDLSSRTCSTCGKAGEIQNIGGWYMAICSECAVKK